MKFTAWLATQFASCGRMYRKRQTCETTYDNQQLLFVYTCLPNATLILFELLTTAPVNALYYIENFQGHKTENAFI